MFGMDHKHCSHVNDKGSTNKRLFCTPPFEHQLEFSEAVYNKIPGREFTQPWYDSSPQGAMQGSYPLFPLQICEVPF